MQVIELSILSCLLLCRLFFDLGKLRQVDEVKTNQRLIFPSPYTESDLELEPCSSTVTGQLTVSAVSTPSLQVDPLAEAFGISWWEQGSRSQCLQAACCCEFGIFFVREHQKDLSICTLAEFRHLVSLLIFAFSLFLPTYAE